MPIRETGLGDGVPPTRRLTAMLDHTDDVPAAGAPTPMPLLASKRKSGGDAEWDDPDALVEDELDDIEEDEDDDLDEDDEFEDEDEEEFDDEEEGDEFDETTSLDELEDEEAYEEENEDWDA
jgi:hypothetical protein